MKTPLIFGVLLTTLLYTNSEAAAAAGLILPHQLSVSPDEQQNQPLIKLRLCIPDSQLPLCHSMVNGRQPESRIECVSAPDKMSCLDRIIKGDADWMILDPEELYIAHRYLPDSVVVTSDIRSAEYYNRDHFYRPVAVIRKSSGIQTINDLRGKRSCHTGFGKTAGWRVPFSHLFANRQLKCGNSSLNALERDLASVAEYFGPTCAPGQWSPEKEGDKTLKLKYPQLCELCKNPESCSKKDHHASYDGALRCLTENNGDVAWTKWDAVRDFFRLNESTPLDITNDYELLCSDGSKAALNSAESPCGLAKRPWRTVILTSRLANNTQLIQDLQQQITALRIEAQNSTDVPKWLNKVLDFYKDSNIEHHFEPLQVQSLTPQAYLKPSHYLNTIWHPSCGIFEKPLRLCVFNQMEMERCSALELATYGQRISPGFSCVMGFSAGHCASLVTKGTADLVVVPATVADKFQNSTRYPQRMVSILRTLEPTGNADAPSVPHRYALAVITEQIAGEFQGDLKPLKNKCSCHEGINSLAGWNAPISVLRDAGELTGDNCNLHQQFSTYCHQSAPASSSQGPLGCLTDGIADVAFVDHVALLELMKASKEPITNLQVLCRNGTVTSLDNFRACHWGLISPQKVLVRGGEQDAVLQDNIRLSLLRAQDLFKPDGKQVSVMKLFGPYYGVHDLIFQDSSVGLQTELSEEEAAPENSLIRDFTCELPGKTASYHSDWFQ